MNALRDSKNTIVRKEEDKLRECCVNNCWVQYWHYWCFTLPLTDYSKLTNCHDVSKLLVLTFSCLLCFHVISDPATPSWHSSNPCSRHSLLHDRPRPSAHLFPLCSLAQWQIYRPTFPHSWAIVVQTFVTTCMWPARPLPDVDFCSHPWPLGLVCLFFLFRPGTTELYTNTGHNLKW